MSTHKQKAVEVEARQYDKTNGRTLATWVKSEGGIASWAPKVKLEDHTIHLPEQLYMLTNQGESSLNLGDWVVKIEGEFWFFTDHAFKKRFDKL